MQIGMFKEIYTLLWNKSNISDIFYAHALLRRGTVFQSASFYRHCTVGAFTCTDIGRDECPALLLSFCRANMTPDLPCIRHACLCALIETRYTIKHALRRMEIFAGRCAFPSFFLWLALVRTASFYTFCREREIKKLARGSVSSSCALWSDTYYLDTYVRAHVQALYLYNFLWHFKQKIFLLILIFFITTISILYKIITLMKRKNYKDVFAETIININCIYIIIWGWK